MTRLLAAITAALLLGLAAPLASARAEAPRVVASIVPVHSIVAGVMEGVGTPVLLVPGGASPHTYALRPSEAEALQRADVVFWIGEGIERFLERPLAALASDARVVALHEAKGIELKGFREGADWDAHDHGDHEEHAHEAHGHEQHAQEEHEHAHEHEKHGHEEHGHEEHAHEEHGHAHDHDGHDLHVWLDPRNARAMVDAIAATLAKADPANAPRYQANGAALAKRLDALESTLAADLAPVRARAYVVFHDAYRYFEDRFGLAPAGAITVEPDRKPSARRLVEIRERIAKTGAVCVFSEPQFEPAVVATVVEGTGARTGVLDPLGADLDPGPDAYFALIRGLAASLGDCLQPQS